MLYTSASSGTSFGFPEGHADRNELLDWARPIAPNLKRAFVVHGEPESCEALAGGALVTEERVVHLAAFNLDPDNKVVRRYPRRWFSGEEE